jgi:hypothetical protein
MKNEEHMPLLERILDQWQEKRSSFLLNTYTFFAGLAGAM